MSGQQQGGYQAAPQAAYVPSTPATAPPSANGNGTSSPHRQGRPIEDDDDVDVPPVHEAVSP